MPSLDAAVSTLRRQLDAAYASYDSQAIEEALDALRAASGDWVAHQRRAVAS